MPVRKPSLIYLAVYIFIFLDELGDVFIHPADVKRHIHDKNKY
jgi:hypothetical protein